MIALFARLGALLKGIAGPEPGRELRLIVRDFRRKPSFNRSRAGHGGSVTGCLGPFRFVLWPGGLGDNPIVHPRSITLLFGPWRKVSLRVGPYRLFMETPGGVRQYGYRTFWRFSSIPADVRENVAGNWITRRDLAGFPMLFRVSVDDLPMPMESCSRCEERVARWDLEPIETIEGVPGTQDLVCSACAEEMCAVSEEEEDAY
jgi:hypothetical protein